MVLSCSSEDLSTCITLLLLFLHNVSLFTVYTGILKPFFWFQTSRISLEGVVLRNTEHSYW